MDEPMIAQEEDMITVNLFDPVFDCQKVFKSLMHSMARPGKTFSIAESMKRLGMKHAGLYAAALTLLDNRCRFYVWDNDEMRESLWEMTYAMPSTVEDADYIFVPSGSDMKLACTSILPKAKTGTLPEPHKNATVFVALDGLGNGSHFVLTGPGVDKKIALELHPDGLLWVIERQKLDTELPRGIELYFLMPDGQVLCVPRKVKMEEA